MEASGAAKGIAVNLIRASSIFPEKYAKTAAVVFMALINAVLTYGGISLFVVTFTTVAIGRTLYEKMAYHGT